MNGQKFADGELVTWPDNEQAQNVLLKADGSIGKFDDALPFMISGKVIPPARLPRIAPLGHGLD